DRVYRRDGEFGRKARVRGVRDDARERLDAALLRLVRRHQRDRCGAVGNRAGIRSRDRAVLLERGLEARNLLWPGFGGTFVVRDFLRAFFSRDFDWRDLEVERAVLVRLLRARQR